MKKTIFLFILIFSLGSIYNALLAQSVSSFDELIITGNVDVVLIESETEEKIEIKNNEENISFHVDGKTLKISSKDILHIKDNSPANISIFYKKLRGIRARAGASVHTDDTLKGDALKLKFASGASGKLTLDINSLDVTVSEGANLKLKGNTDWQTSKVATGGNLYALRLSSRNAIIKAGTGGTAKITVSKSLEANAKTGGNILYEGTPEKLEIKRGFSGTVDSI